VSNPVMLGGNPVYDAPADLDFEQALAKVGTAIHLSSYENETSQHCQWLLPQTHPFETWGDCRAQDGTICVTQPLIETLLGRQVHARTPGPAAGRQVDSQTLVRRAVDRVAGRTLNDKEWRQTAARWFPGRQRSEASFRRAEGTGRSRSQARGGRRIGTGVLPQARRFTTARFANNGWLQETPHLVSKLTWDNAALVSPATAKKLGLEIGSMVRLELGGRSLQIPASSCRGRPTVRSA